MHFLVIVKCFHVFLSCIVWVKTIKNYTYLNIKQLIKHENTKTLNYSKKVHYVYSPLDVLLFKKVVPSTILCCSHESCLKLVLLNMYNQDLKWLSQCILYSVMNKNIRDFCALNSRQGLFFVQLPNMYNSIVPYSDDDLSTDNKCREK
jgi:hypothetical protein